MSDTPTPAAPTDDARIGAALDAWKRKLLDLTKRNRALNFRMTRGVHRRRARRAAGGGFPAPVPGREAHALPRRRAPRAPGRQRRIRTPVRARGPVSRGGYIGRAAASRRDAAIAAPAEASGSIASTAVAQSGSADVASAVAADGASIGTTSAPVSADAAGSASTEAV